MAFTDLHEGILLEFAERQAMCSHRGLMGECDRIDRRAEQHREEQKRYYQRKRIADPAWAAAELARVAEYKRTQRAKAAQRVAA